MHCDQDFEVWPGNLSMCIATAAVGAGGEARVTAAIAHWLKLRADFVNQLAQAQIAAGNPSGAARNLDAEIMLRSIVAALHSGHWEVDRGTPY